MQGKTLRKWAGWRQHAWDAAEWDCPSCLTIRARASSVAGATEAQRSGLNIACHSAPPAASISQPATNAGVRAPCPRARAACKRHQAKAGARRLARPHLGRVLAPLVPGHAPLVGGADLLASPQLLLIRLLIARAASSALLLRCRHCRYLLVAEQRLLWCWRHDRAQRLRRCKARLLWNDAGRWAITQARRRGSAIGTGAECRRRRAAVVAKRLCSGCLAAAAGGGCWLQGREWGRMPSRGGSQTRGARRPGGGWRWRGHCLLPSVGGGGARGPAQLRLYLSRLQTCCTTKEAFLVVASGAARCKGAVYASGSNGCFQRRDQRCGACEHTWSTLSMYPAAHWRCVLSLSRLLPRLFSVCWQTGPRHPHAHANVSDHQIKLPPASSAVILATRKRPAMPPRVLLLAVDNSDVSVLLRLTPR